MGLIFFSTDNVIIGILHTIVDRVTTGPANTFSELEDDPVPDSNMGVAVCVTRGVANEDVRVAGGVSGLVGPG